MRFLEIRVLWTSGHRPVSTVMLFMASLVLSATSKAVADDPGSVEFFESKIRPVLVKRCYSCHSSEADETGGTLWLDSSSAMLEGGDSGPVLKPGHAEESLLISAIRYESTEMPPDQPLPAEVVEDFVRWINAGAVDPRVESGGPQRFQIDLEAGRSFWAFQPLRDVPSTVAQETTTSGLIDRVLDQARNDAGIEANGAAPPATRLRRLAFDLTGLPPDPEVRKRWLADPSPEAWAAIVDQLLDTRAFAQHWARHWMDVARYADSNGSDFNATFHDAWRYRDYLVDSFDRDRSFAQMIRQQIAGDLLPFDSDAERHDNLVASTFLMLGTKMLSERDKEKLTLDVVDEQIDTVGRAFLGLTLGCARCHDHKFDPIPTEDYYALAGIFRSTQTLNGESQQFVSTFNRTALPASEELVAAHRTHASDLKRVKKSLEETRKALGSAQAEPLPGIVLDDTDATRRGKWVASTYTKGFVGDGYIHDGNSRKGKASIEFRTMLPASGEYRVRLAYSSNGNRASRVPVTIHDADSQSSHFVNQQVKPAEAPWHDLGVFTFSDQEEAVVSISNAETDGYVIADAVQFLPMEEAKTNKQVDEKQIERVAELQKRVKGLESELEQLEKDAPGPLPYAMAPRDLPSDQISDSPVHIRGEVRNVGEVIPRGFLSVCDPVQAGVGDEADLAPRRQMNPTGSGRIELANWLTDPDHPLVSRVVVNRVWSHLFGEGLVRSVDNFGQRGEHPTHPELLDALALEFMRGGWRFKGLIRQIVLSKSYTRSSEFSSQAVGYDPENRLLWRAHRKRLPAESIRDAMLTAAGVLTAEEPTAPVAGKGVLVTKNNGDSKAAAAGLDAPVRTLYLPIIRSNVSPLLTSLDGADPDLLVGKRPTTNVPGQALVLLNSPDVIRWAHQTADRIRSTHATVPEQLIASFRICLSRDPSPSELALAQRFIRLGDADASEDEATASLRDWVAAIFASTEFRFLD